MNTWLITGGAGSGKSWVLSKLKKLLNVADSAGFSADDAARNVMREPPIMAALSRLFGPQAAGGTQAAREWLRSQILPDPELRQQLERLVHPPVLTALEEGRQLALLSGSNLFLAEVPLHYEIGASVSADFVIVVASSRSVQVRRMMENRGLDEQTVRKFLDAQWPVEAKVERADSVIWNDGNLASLEAQVLTLASPLLQA